MRCALITGSRADKGALDAVAEELYRRLHVVRWISVDPKGPSQRRSDARLIAADAMIRCFGNGSAIDVDFAVVHGDRYEIVAATLAASLMGVPVVHIGGGDVTEGSQDEGYRHAISKMAHLHCVPHADAADRLIAMGEHPDRVHVTGDPELDRLRDFLPEPESCVRAMFGLGSEGRLALVLMHPNTVDDSGGVETVNLMTALDQHRDLAMVIVGPNADPGADVVRERLSLYARTRPNASYSDDVSTHFFLSLMRHAAVMIGNSSAGIIEAPFFGTPVVNVGDRQKGRPRAACIIDVAPDARAIAQAIGLALYGRFKPSSLYGDGKSAPRVVDAMEAVKNPSALLRKGWYERPPPLTFQPEPIWARASGGGL